MAEEKGAKEKKKESGITYLTSWGSIFEMPSITASEIGKYVNNVYSKQVAKRQQYLLFTERFDLEVFDPDGEADTELKDRIMNMVDNPEVMLWEKMQQAYSDIFYWGASLFNPVWAADGREIFLKALRHLPAESFASPPNGDFVIYCPILQGITMVDDEVVYFQEQGDLNPVKLENIYMVKDPTEPNLAGFPIVAPLIPVLKMLDFSWQSQMQKVNRIGAPLLFMKITDPVGDDVAYGNEILKKWGKNTAFQLRQNMELIEPDLKDTSTALDTVHALEKILIEHFSPASSISKEGTVIGGSSWGEVELLQSYISGIHRWMEKSFEDILSPYLELNGFADYTLEITIPNPSVDRSDVLMRQAETGFKTKSLTVNEIRDRLEAEELDEEELEKLKEGYPKAEAPNPLGTNPFGESAPGGSPKEDNPEGDIENEGEPGKPPSERFGMVYAKPVYPSRVQKEIEDRLKKGVDELQKKIMEAVAQYEGALE